MTTLKLIQIPTKFLFFTGKGGVGKTSLSTAVALNLADSGKSVLLVSTDPASNLDEMLNVELKNTAVQVPHVPRLFVLNIDPTNAAESYRLRVLEQMPIEATFEERSKVREELSGACTTEIAAFDEFSDLLAEDSLQYDHIIFDTAPTGHTLRLLSLPKAWTGFLKDNDRGASCLGPHSGLKMQEARFQAALNTLSDSKKTTVVLVARPDKGSISEAAKTSIELSSLGLTNQRLVINAVFHASDKNDLVARSIETIGQQALDEMPAVLRDLPRDEILLRTFDTVGLEALRSLLHANSSPSQITNSEFPHVDTEGLGRLVDELAKSEHGLIMVMGKGGVGKTTVAAAIALGLVKRGKKVHLNTTDPAAHLEMTLKGEVTGLKVGRIDPVEETKKYVAKIMDHKGKNLNQAEKDLLLEDLKSPCTEEVAVFHAFSRVVSEAQNSFVVLDTAPTGHSLLLMDATGAYHRQVVQEFKGKKVTTPLMRLQDPQYTQIILVTLPETTPVSQAAELQADLRRAQIEPYAWVINKSLISANTKDPLLLGRLEGENRQIKRIENGLSKRLFAVPWLIRPPIGIEELSKLV
ncbi:MAG: arsenical pump-driving ATPase [Bdellovibrio sp.]|nr:arsenical pump-driving ATPase [Bdellovibrio sp.]